jgi:hypothetical protein
MDEQDAIPICPFCLRPISVAGKQSLKELVPRLQDGKNGPTVLLHHICHN